jgi:hypothetical protein
MGGYTAIAEVGQRPPLTLDLYYLITPLLTDAADRQIVLGKVMQVLYDRPSLEAPDLAGSLATATSPHGSHTRRAR